MPNVTLSDAALAKIETDLLQQKRVRSPNGDGELAARLRYFRRSYETDFAGNTREFGPGLTVGFFIVSVATDEPLLEIASNRGFRLFVGPLEAFAAGKHFIDFSDQFRFTLISLP